NITGKFKGKWYPLNLTTRGSVRDSTYNETESIAAYHDFDFLKSQGTLSLDLFSNASRDSIVNIVSGVLRIRSDSWQGLNGDILIMLEGLHFKNNGSLWLTGGVDGNSFHLYEIPLLMQTNDSFEAVKRISLDVNSDYRKKIELKLKENPDSRREEAILLVPEGLDVKRTPLMMLSLRIYSPNCDIFMKSPQLKGFKLEKLNNKRIDYAIFAGLIAVIELILTLRQIEYSSTQS
ncbi:hypothetical protein HK096_003800, partial [Nowakowskiella sp. JEL0078]